MDYNLEWQRGLEGLPPSYHEEDEAAAAAATRPSIPSSVPIEKSGQLGIPRTRFDVGRLVRPAPSPSLSTMSGAMGLVYPSLRPRRMLPRYRRGY